MAGKVEELTEKLDKKSLELKVTKDTLRNKSLMVSGKDKGSSDDKEEDGILVKYTKKVVNAVISTVLDLIFGNDKEELEKVNPGAVDAINDMSVGQLESHADALKNEIDRLIQEIIKEREKERPEKENDKPDPEQTQDTKPNKEEVKVSEADLQEIKKGLSDLEFSNATSQSPTNGLAIQNTENKSIER